MRGAADYKRGYAAEPSASVKNFLKFEKINRNCQISLKCYLPRASTSLYLLGVHGYDLHGRVAKHFPSAPSRAGCRPAAMHQSLLLCYESAIIVIPRNGGY